MKGKIFNAQEVQSILNGSKVMFREVIKPQPKADYGQNYTTWVDECGLFHVNDGLDKFFWRKAPYQIGQEIFVKERFFEEIHPDSLQKNGKIHYAASCDYEVIKVDGDGFQIFYKDGTPASPWKSPVHMKQEHSRLFLRITDIKVERLQDISYKDCLREGIEKVRGRYHRSTFPETYDYVFRDYTSGDYINYDPIQSFRSLWNSTHKKPEEKWEANPWVWKVEFEIINN